MSTEETKLAEARAYTEAMRRTHQELGADVIDGALEFLAAENEKLRAKLDMPCGSCHPCTQWANQTRGL